MIIRLMNTDDVDAFRRIRLEALRLSPQSYASGLQQWQGFSAAEWRRRLADACILAAFDGDEAVGIMRLQPEIGSHALHRATISMVYLQPRCRGTGLAAALLEHLIAAAQHRKIRQLELVVSAENPVAIGFYRRQGFAETGRIPAALLHDGREIDELIMVRRIDAK